MSDEATTEEMQELLDRYIASEESAIAELKAMSSHSNARFEQDVVTLRAIQKRVTETGIPETVASGDADFATVMRMIQKIVTMPSPPREYTNVPVSDLKAYARWAILTKVTLDAWLHAIDAESTT